jgi:hypothetical protein
VARDDYPDVDFVAGPPDPAADEELPEPKDRAGPLWQRLKRPLSIAAILAVVATTAVKLSSFSDGTASAAQDHATPTPTTSTHVRPGDLAGQSIPVNFPVAGRGDGIITDRGNDVPCPPSHACLSIHAVPPTVIDAVRARFPGASDQSSTTVQFTDHTVHRVVLWLRTMHVGVDKGQLDIRIVPLAPGDPNDAGYSTDGTGLLAYTHRRLAGYTVEVVAHLSHTTKVPLAQLAELATDVRLVAVR